MWVVTTDDRTVNIEGARRVEVTVRPGSGETGHPLGVIVSAVWPGGERETLAEIPAAASDTDETLVRKASASVEALRHTLHRAGQLCDLTGMAGSHGTADGPADPDSEGPLW